METADANASAVFFTPFRGGRAAYSAGRVSPEAVDVFGLPGLLFAAEMENRGVLHNPAEVVFPGAAQEIARVIPGVVVPAYVLHGQDPFAVHGVEHVLVRQDKPLAVLPDVAEYIGGQDFAPAGGEVHKQDAGVEVVMLRAEAQLVHAVCKLGDRRVRRGGEKPAVQIGLPELADWVYDQSVRVEIDRALMPLGQQFGREQAVVHLLGILLRDRRAFKERVLHGQRRKAPAIRRALAGRALERGAGYAAVEQNELEFLAGVVQGERGEQHLQLREVVFVKRRQKFDGIHAVSPFWTGYVIAKYSAAATKGQGRRKRKARRAYIRQEG